MGSGLSTVSAALEVEVRLDCCCGSNDVTDSICVRCLVLLIAAGAFMTGLISAGIGETSVSVLHGQCRIPMRVAAATSVFVTLGVVFASSLTDILVAGVDSVPWDLVTFTMPGVLIGGQIGVRIGKGVSSATSEVMLIVLLLILGGAMLLQSLKGFGVLHWGDDN